MARELCIVNFNTLTVLHPRTPRRHYDVGRRALYTGNVGGRHGYEVGSSWRCRGKDPVDSTVICMPKEKLPNSARIGLVNLAHRDGSCTLDRHGRVSFKHCQASCELAERGETRVDTA